jgi:hypothetical protein
VSVSTAQIHLQPGEGHVTEVPLDTVALRLTAVDDSGESSHDRLGLDVIPVDLEDRDLRTEFVIQQERLDADLAGSKTHELGKTNEHLLNDLDAGFDLFIADALRK